LAVRPPATLGLEGIWMGREGGDLALEFQVPCRISEWAGNPGRTGPTTAVAMGGKASVGRPYAAEVAARGATIQAGGRKGSGPDRRTPKDARDVPSQTGRTGPLVVNQWGARRRNNQLLARRIKKPDGNGQSTVDVTPIVSLGLPPIPVRISALEVERDWLHNHWLSPDR
jgi:hypothetical protein